MKSKILTSAFIYCRLGDLIKIVRRIIDSMTNNAYFPNPTPTLADIEKALEAYSAALSNAGKFDREKVSIKNDKKAILMELLKDLANYVTQTSRGDRTMLISSGFDVTSEVARPQKLPPKLQVEVGMPGMVTSRVQRIPRARAYVHQYTADPLTPESVWISVTTVNPVHTFTGLATGTKVWIQVTVIDRKGENVYYDPVSRIVN